MDFMLKDIMNKNLSQKTDYNDLVYLFVSIKSDPISFNNFRFPLGFIADRRDGKTELVTAKQKQINFELDLKKISVENRKQKSKEQIDAINDIKIFTIHEKNLSNYMMIILQ